MNLNASKTVKFIVIQGLGSDIFVTYTDGTKDTAENTSKTVEDQLELYEQLKAAFPEAGRRFAKLDVKPEVKEPEVVPVVVPEVKAPVPEVKEPEAVADQEKVTKEVKVTRSVVPAEWAQKHKEVGSDDVGDKLTETLNKADDKETAFKAICATNGIDPLRWVHLNFGMQRMNLSNVLRNKAKKGLAIILEV